MVNRVQPVVIAIIKTLALAKTKERTILRRKTEEFIVTAQEDLDKLVDEWIELLHLQAWEIQAKLVDDVDFYGMHIEGENCINSLCKQSDISIITAEGRTEKCDEATNAFPYDMEKVLVHEMLHCTFCDLMELGTEAVPMEAMEQYSKNAGDENSMPMQTIGYVMAHAVLDEMARTLVDIKRMKQREE